MSRDGRAARDAPVSAGVFGRHGKRNVPATINRSYSWAFFQDGHIKTLEEQVVQPIQNAMEMDLTLKEASARAGLTPKAIANAFVRYVRSILSGDSPYDRFVNGDRQALTDEKEHNTGVA